MRYEFAHVPVPMTVASPGDVLGDGVVEDGNIALVLGDPYATAYVIEGTPNRLREFTAAASAALDRHMHATSDLSADAAGVIAGLVAPSWEVNSKGVFTTDRVWNEIREAFPVRLFESWAARHDADPEDEQFYCQDID